MELFGNRAEHHELWHFVTCHLLAAELANFGFGCSCIRPKFDEGARNLAPFLVWFGHDCGEIHRWMAVQNVFHLDRGNVLAAGYDDVFRAVFDPNVSVRLDHRQIAGVQPAAREGLLCGRGVL